MSSELSQLRQLMVGRGMVDLRASDEALLATFTQWAQANGFTAATYGTRWDDAALEALAQAPIQVGAASASRGVDWSAVMKVAVPVAVGVAGLWLVIRLSKK